MKFQINGFILYGYQRIHLIWLSDSSYMVINGFIFSFILHGYTVLNSCTSENWQLHRVLWQKMTANDLAHAQAHILSWILLRVLQTTWVYARLQAPAHRLGGYSHPIGSAGCAPDKTTSQLVNYVNFIFSISSWLLMDALTSSTATLYNFKYGFNISSATHILAAILMTLSLYASLRLP